MGINKLSKEAVLHLTQPQSRRNSFNQKIHLDQTFLCPRLYSDHCGTYLEHVITCKTEPKHLFWYLIYLKVYSTEDVHFTVRKTCRNTFWKRSWELIKRLVHLKIVSTKVFIPYFIAVNSNLLIKRFI